MPTIGLLHSGRKRIFGKLVDDVLVPPLLQAGIDLPDTPQARRYAGDLLGDLYGNIDASARALAADADTTFKLLVAAGGPEPAIALRDALRRLGKTTSVVFTTVTDPKDQGLVNSNTGPGGTNFTGMAGQTSERDRDRLEILFKLLSAKGMISKNDNVGLLVAGHRFHKAKHVQDVQNRADHASLKLHLKPQHGWDATSLTDIADAFAFFTDPRNDIKGVVVMADSLFNDLRADVVKIANGAKLTPAIPTIYQWRQFVEQDGLVSFGPEIEEAYSVAAAAVKTIVIGGINPAGMTCSNPDRSKFKVYVKAATAFTQLRMTPAEIPDQLTLLDGNRYDVEQR